MALDGLHRFGSRPTKGRSGRKVFDRLRILFFLCLRLRDISSGAITLFWRKFVGHGEEGFGVGGIGVGDEDGAGVGTDALPIVGFSGSVSLVQKVVDSLLDSLGGHGWG